MASLLRFLNELPFPLTIRHYHVFTTKAEQALKDHTLDSPESWDALRAEDPHFSISENREEWLLASEAKEKKDGQDSRLIERAEDVAALLREKRITTVVSIGAGGAGLEYQLKKRIPSLRIICTEYAPETVRRLKAVFTEADEVRSFDMHTDSWDIVAKRTDAETTCCLMYRLDAQCTDREWRAIFARMNREGVPHVLYIPTGFLSAKSLVTRLLRRISWMLSGKRLTFSGYLRTRATFRSYWRGLYEGAELSLGGLSGFWLSRAK